ncbi:MULTISPECIES: phage tail tube protein [unclassified Cupriavidus]|uniref:phage tail tube protein n=1 Tax=unclassified Cupriavidus TaxID=2640874 RepID=UPI00313B905F
MPNAKGLFKQLRYKLQSGQGVAAGTSGGQILRRVTSDIALNKDTYQSEEIRSDQQIADFRHGVRRVAGTINGEISPGTYADLIAAILRRDFTAVTAITGMTIAIAAASIVGGRQTYTVTRSTGSFLTDGIKAGDVGRLTAGSFNAANINKNLLVLAVTALALTVIPLNGVALVAESGIATATLSLPGKKTYVPTSAHTDKYISFEHWFSDVAQSELFTDCKLAQMDLTLPATGMATIAAQIQGLDMTTGTSAYFTAPAVETTSGIVAAVNGVLLAAGVPVGLLTGMSATINANMTGDPVVGQNTLPDLYPGRVVVTGQMTAYFQDAVLRDAFINETEIGITAVLATTNGPTADFIAITMSRVKLGGAAKDDGEKGLIQTIPFQALLNGAGGAGTANEKTTISVQDSLA